MKFCVKDLISQGIVKAKTYTEGPYTGLSVLKYSNSVFWDNRWGEDSRLLDCRGMVVDQDDNVVIWPFTKIFNRFENETDLPLDMHVSAVRKVNGFMASAGAYKDKLLISTTGTLDSEFAQLAEKYILDSCQNLTQMINWMEGAGATFIFEICDPNDPHIVAEEVGVYLIGIRVHGEADSYMTPETGLDAFAKVYGFKRPEVFNTVKVNDHQSRFITFGDVVGMAKTCDHEGFIVRSIDQPGYPLLMKIKSPYYLTKKFLMRGGIKKCEAIWDHGDRVKKIVEEEYYPLVDFLKSTYNKDQWMSLNEQARGDVIDQFINGSM